MLLAVHVAALGAAAALVILSGRSLLCTDASCYMSLPSEVGVAGRRRRPSRPGDSTSAGGRTVARARARQKSGGCLVLRARLARRREAG